MGIRTPDLLITNQLLYQLSYVGGALRLRIIAHCRTIVTINFRQNTAEQTTRKMAEGGMGGAGRIMNEKPCMILYKQEENRKGSGFFMEG